MPNTQKQTISAREAARRMGCSDDIIRAGLISKQFPFGQALRLESGRYRYFIPLEAFERWMYDPSGKSQKL
ncbi:hypothetical protein SAMN02745823_03803 [Sporobacter termitidis DSM 10068]|uniref:Helix-turn-helix domain-containing protein n=1 Tax=Sporobacter termitidis DSM 10068 TaxID=1123282 RepID=A0A1M5ZIJ9_9FIRM|nr:hypothetical protein [Sporobacter termitidis]SHI24127.1 hypothetical protein SAMN02745823_03803 [Sporobacter termitidis DSM 10068]